VNPQRLLRDENLELIEFPKEGLFELSDESPLP